MNIFYTDKDPILAARDHCSVHVNKMMIEYAQMLCHAHHVCDGDEIIDGIYGDTNRHKYHPCTKWVRESLSNYLWLHACAMELSKMYMTSRKRNHKTLKTLVVLTTPPKNLSDIGFTIPAAAVKPASLKSMRTEGKILECYHLYLNQKFKTWRTRIKKRKMLVKFMYGPPEWITDEVKVLIGSG